MPALQRRANAQGKGPRSVSPRDLAKQDLSQPSKREFAVADGRTLRKLLNQAGLDNQYGLRAHANFLERQQFVPQSSPCLHELIQTTEHSDQA
jgi:hypothetical protein